MKDIVWDIALPRNSLNQMHPARQITERPHETARDLGQTANIVGVYFLFVLATST
jgi:hypothetical protein